MNAQGLLGTGESCSSSSATQAAQYRGAVNGPAPNGDTLSRLAATDPKTFDRVMDAIADELQSIADGTEGPRHNFLSAMANQFAATAAQSRTLPEVTKVTQPLPVAPAGARSKDTSTSSSTQVARDDANGASNAMTHSETQGAQRHHHHRHHHRSQGVGKLAPHSAENLVAKIVDAVNAALSNNPLATASSRAASSSTSPAGASSGTQSSNEGDAATQDSALDTI